jgi:hypothetical protein
MTKLHWFPQNFIVNLFTLSCFLKVVGNQIFFLSLMGWPTGGWKTHNVRTPPRSDSGEATPQNHQRENGLVANCKRIFIQERSRAHGHTPRRGRGLWRRVQSFLLGILASPRQLSFVLSVVLTHHCYWAQSAIGLTPISTDVPHRLPSRESWCWAGSQQWSIPSILALQR